MPSTTRLADLTSRLQRIAARYPAAALASSFGAEDMVLTDIVARHALPKFNPLADWSDDDVWSYLHSRGVPTNPLHARGYPSIGCAPCTRAIEPGEDLRAGRWWWEQPEHRECGLHRRPLDIAVREEPAGVSP